jgi:Na+:H+ antiporter, NhaA family
MTVKKTGLTDLFKLFLKSSSNGGFILLFCTLASLILTNLLPGSAYKDFWNIELPIDFGGIHMHHTLVEWINDGLMTLFFLLVGLEIEREIYIGEISNLKSALLPVMGAIGGMLAPALVFLIVNFNSPETLKGMGIPTATDIAFAIAVMGILGNRVPPSLKVFLTALAIIDDIGAIFIIAIFYGTGFSSTYLLLSAGLFLLLLLLNRLKVNTLWVYLPLGILLWYFMMHSGIHATLAGVLLAFAIPFQNGGKKTISYRLEAGLQKPVSYIIIPLFALANTAIVINPALISQLFTPASIGIFLGLVLGKPLGIFGAAWISDKIGLAKIPENTSKMMIWGAGMLGGIGFTMAIFVTNLAFKDPGLIALGKVAILLASAVAAVGGYWVLASFSKINRG